MKLKIYLALLCVCFATIHADRSCPENEEYRKDTCDGTCESPAHRCRIEKFYSCFCLDGYVRNENGKCIRESECPNKCGDNEEYRVGSCDTICLEPDRICVTDVHEGCFCVYGFARDDRNACVDQDECVVTTTEGEEIG